MKNTFFFKVLLSLPLLGIFCSAEAATVRTVLCQQISCVAFQPNGARLAQGVCDVSAEWLYTFKISDQLVNPTQPGVHHTIVETHVTYLKNGEEVFTVDPMKNRQELSGDNIFDDSTGPNRAGFSAYIPHIQPGQKVQGTIFHDGGGVISTSTVTAVCSLK